MNDNNTSQLICEMLSQLWIASKRPEFVQYIHEAYEFEASSVPNFHCLYIGETEEGDFEHGPLTGLMKRWWKMDDTGLCVIKFPKLDWGGDSIFVPTPEIFFYHEGERVTVSERLGQRLIKCKSGRLLFAEGKAHIYDVKTVYM